MESTVTATERADEGAMATSTATPSRFKKAGEEAIAAGEKAGEGAATVAMSQLRDEGLKGLKAAQVAKSWLWM